MPLLGVEPNNDARVSKDAWFYPELMKAPSKIEDRFTKHDDGEFVRLPSTHPYSVTVPLAESGRVLYTTKPACVLACMEGGHRAAAVRVVGRAGLPNEQDVTWLRELAGNRPVEFLGDADPADLLVFAWLRARMRVTYLGVSDALIRESGVPMDDSCTIPLSEAELAAFALLGEVFPDCRAVVGRQCAALLDRGRKIELEAVVNSAHGGATLADWLAR